MNDRAVKDGFVMAADIFLDGPRIAVRGEDAILEFAFKAISMMLAIGESENEGEYTTKETWDQYTYSYRQWI